MTLGTERLRREYRWAALLFVLAGACGEVDTEIIQPGAPEERVVVLNSLGLSYQVFELDAQGLPTFSARVALPDNFDGVTFDVRGSLALTTASELKGSWVFISDLVPGGTSFPLPLPDPLDDPAAARYLNPDTAFVAARGSGILYRLTLADSLLSPLTADVAQSPFDVVPFGNRLYVIDSNQARTDFRTLGPSRVVAVGLASGQPEDAVDLTGFGAVTGVVLESKLFVLESGAFPDPQAKLAVVDLGGGALSARELDLGGFGLSLEAGNDNRLYISAVPDLAAFDVKRVFVLDPVTEEFVNGPADPLPLKRPDGTDASCYAATASSDGKVFCIEDRGLEKGLLFVYGSDLQGKASITLDALPTDLWVLDLTPP